MHSLSAAVPASVIGVPCVRAHVHSRLLQLLNLLVVEALFDVKELLADGVLVWVTCRTD